MYMHKNKLEYEFDFPFIKINFIQISLLHYNESQIKNHTFHWSSYGLFPFSRHTASSIKIERPLKYLNIFPHSYAGEKKRTVSNTKSARKFCTTETIARRIIKCAPITRATERILNEWKWNPIYATRCIVACSRNCRSKPDLIMTPARQKNPSTRARPSPHSEPVTSEPIEAPPAR